MLVKVRSTHVQFGVSPQVYQRLMDHFPFLLPASNVPVPQSPPPPFSGLCPGSRHVSCSSHSCALTQWQAVEGLGQEKEVGLLPLGPVLPRIGREDPLPQG